MRQRVHYITTNFNEKQINTLAIGDSISWIETNGQLKVSHTVKKYYHNKKVLLSYVGGYINGSGCSYAVFIDNMVGDFYRNRFYEDQEQYLLNIGLADHVCYKSHIIREKINGNYYYYQIWSDIVTNEPISRTISTKEKYEKEVRPKKLERIIG